jgi:hypothetical protein
MSSELGVGGGAGGVIRTLKDGEGRVNTVSTNEESQNTFDVR